MLKLQIYILKSTHHIINKSLQRNSGRSIHNDSDLVWQYPEVTHSKGSM